MTMRWSYLAGTQRPESSPSWRYRVTAREILTGSLAFAGMQKKDGVRAVDGLDAARWVTVRRR